MRQTETETAKSFAESQEIPYNEVSTLTGEGFKELFDSCINDVYQNFRKSHEQPVDIMQNKEFQKDYCK